MLGSLILYLKGTRIVMFQLSGFYKTRFQAPFQDGGGFIGAEYPGPQKRLTF